MPRKASHDGAISTKSLSAVLPARKRAASPEPALVVRVTYAPNLAGLLAGRGVSAPLAAYLRELSVALGLAARPTLRFEPARAGYNYGPPLRLWVGSRRLLPLLPAPDFARIEPASVSFSLPPEDNVAVAEPALPSLASSSREAPWKGLGEDGERGSTRAALTDYLCRSIYHHRAALVTAADAQTLLQTAGLPAEALPPAAFLALLRRLAARGFSLRRMAPALARLKTGELRIDHPYELYDPAISGDAPALALELARDLEAECAALEPAAEEAANLFFATGVPHPPCRVRAARGLAAGHFRVRLNDLPLPPVAALPTGLVALETQSGVVLVGPLVAKGQHPLTGAPLYLTPAGSAASIGDTPPAQLDRREHILAHLRAALVGAAAGFLTGDLLEHILARLSENAPVLVEAARAAHSLAFTAEVLRELLAEGIGIYRLSPLLEELAALEGPQPLLESEHLLFIPPAARLAPLLVEDPGLPPGLAEAAAALRRTAARRNLTNTLAPAATLDAWTLDAPAGGWLAGLPPEPDPDDQDRLAQAVYRALGPRLADATAPVLLAQPPVRRRAAALLHTAMPRLVVVNAHELLPSLELSLTDLSLDPATDLPHEVGRMKQSW